MKKKLLIAFILIAAKNFAQAPEGITAQITVTAISATLLTTGHSVVVTSDGADRWLLNQFSGTQIAIGI